MNAASARSRRASAPFNATKRAPESRAAASKSIMPQRFAERDVIGAEFDVRRIAAVTLVPAAHFDIAVLVGAVGRIGVGQVRQRRQQVVALLLPACASSTPVSSMRCFSAATCSISRSASASFFLRLGGADRLRGGVARGFRFLLCGRGGAQLRIGFDDLLRSVARARGAPRRRRRVAAFSRMARISCMARG